MSPPEALVSRAGLVQPPAEAARLVSAMEDVMIHTWSLAATSETPPESADFTSYSSGLHMAETVFDVDDRTRVPTSDFAPGGKYRSIVKLLLRFGDKWQMGTGWLIRDDLLVTAGHCAYDHTHNFGPVQEVKAYIGYDGKASVGTSNCQFRRGVKVSVNSTWYKGPSQQSDVSIIRVSPPFESVVPFKYADTPRQATLKLGVVGYPGDLQHGEHMWEHFEPEVSFDLPRNNGMITYRIDSYGGNSGSPVLRGDLVSIGVHAYGGAINKASAIGTLGNTFAHYVQALEQKTSEKPGEMFIVTIKGAAHPPETESGGLGDPIESWDGETGPPPEGHPSETALDKFSRLMSTGLKLATPPPTEAATEAGMPVVMGSAAAPLGSLAAIAYGAAGRFAEASAPSSSSTSAASSTTVGSISSLGPEAQAGLVECAIMGEAALSAVMTMSQETNEAHGIFLRMSEHVEKNRESIQSVRRVLGPVSNTALGGIVAHHYARTRRGRPRKFDVEASPATESGTTAEHVEAFAQGVVLASKGEAGSESAEAGPAEFSLSSLANLVKNGLNIAKPVLNGVVNTGIPLLAAGLGALESTEAMAEAEADAKPLLDGMTARAILGEAALAAVANLPLEAAQSEEIFGTLFKTIRQIAPVVLSVAPSVIGAVGQVVGSAMKSTLSGESAEADNWENMRRKRPRSQAEFLNMFEGWKNG